MGNGRLLSAAKGEIAGIHQRAKIDTELLDDIAFHLDHGDLEQDLLLAVDIQHIDDVGAEAARLDVAATVVVLLPKLLVMADPPPVALLPPPSC